MQTSLSLKEKVGYGLGDAAANLVWRGALAYLAVFYTDTFGLTAAAAAMLFLVVRLSDGITDIIMGMIADRTNTKLGAEVHTQKQSNVVSYGDISTGTAPIVVTIEDDGPFSVTRN